MQFPCESKVNFTKSIDIDLQIKLVLKLLLSDIAAMLKPYEQGSQSRVLLATSTGPLSQLNDSCISYSGNFVHKMSNIEVTKWTNVVRTCFAVRTVTS